MQKIITLLITLCVMWFACTLFQQKPLHSSTVACGKSVITLTQTCNGVDVVETSKASGRVDAHQWITYTLLPELSKTYGATTISHLFVPYPTTTSLQRATALCKRRLVKKIILPKAQKNPRFASEGIKKLEECAQAYGIMIEHAHATSMPFFPVAQ